ncbi:MAG: hypothetical protein V1792_19075 [Pseudomonadota bacterium]
MRILPVVILLGLLLAFGGCSSLMGGKFAGRDGKESPFKPPDDTGGIQSDPTSPLSF